MSLISDIQKDFGTAMKSRDAVLLDTLRLLKSAIHNREIEKKGKGDEASLTDDEVLEILKREVKKRKEASTMYVSAGRAELAEREQAECVIIEKYLPEQAPDEEIEKVVISVLSKFPDATQKDFGKIMGGVIKELRGRASGDRISSVIKEKLHS